MRELKIEPTGGKTGTISQFREQMKRILSSRISFTVMDSDGKNWIQKNINIVNQSEMEWGDNLSKSKSIDFISRFHVSDELYEETLNTPIPIDMKKLSVLKNSSLAFFIIKKCLS